MCTLSIKKYLNRPIEIVSMIIYHDNILNDQYDQTSECFRLTLSY